MLSASARRPELAGPWRARRRSEGGPRGRDRSLRPLRRRGRRRCRGWASTFTATSGCVAAKASPICRMVARAMPVPPMRKRGLHGRGVARERAHDGEKRGGGFAKMARRCTPSAMVHRGACGSMITHALAPREDRHGCSEFLNSRVKCTVERWTCTLIDAACRLAEHPSAEQQQETRRTGGIVHEANCRNNHAARFRGWALVA